MNPDVAPKREILGLILAGGTSKRFGPDKALADLAGQPIVAHVVACAAPQVDLLVLNAAADLAGTGLPLVPDLTPGEGPLGGLISGLHWAKKNGFDLVATFACDTPRFPTDTVARLRTAMEDGAECAMARHGSQVHHTFALVRTSCLDRLDEAYGAGMRRLRAVGGILRCALPDFSDYRDGPGGDAFFNINTQDDLDLFKVWSQDHGRPLQ